MWCVWCGSLTLHAHTFTHIHLPYSHDKFDIHWHHLRGLFHLQFMPTFAPFTEHLPPPRPLPTTPSPHLTISPLHDPFLPYCLPSGWGRPHSVHHSCLHCAPAPHAGYSWRVWPQAPLENHSNRASLETHTWEKRTILLSVWQRNVLMWGLF